MKKLLSFDISSSTIGWSLFEIDIPTNTAELKDVSYYHPPSSANVAMSTSLEATERWVIDLINSYHPDEIVIEEYSKAFMGGRSTAGTIIKLAVFNEVISLAAFKVTKILPTKYAVQTIRASIGKIYAKKIVSKDDVFEEIASRVTKTTLELKKTRKGSAVKYQDHCYDMIDSVAVGLTACYKSGITNITI